ncbi:MAG: hypothetical protein ACXWIN_10250 [Burkholderiaceae bacterium]
MAPEPLNAVARKVTPVSLLELAEAFEALPPHKRRVSAEQYQEILAHIAAIRSGEST